MIPFNIITIVALIGFMGTGSLTVISYVVYWTLGRRLLDLLLANALVCSAAVCLGIFFMAGAVPPGVVPGDIPHAARTALMWYRLNFVIGWMAIPVFLHFVLRYCRAENFLARHIGPVYLVSALASLVTWSPWFLQAPIESVAVSLGGKSLLSPWMPVCGPLFMVFVLPWVGSQVYAQVLLWRRKLRSERAKDRSWSRVGLVRLALVIQAAGATFDSLWPLLAPPRFTVLPATSVTMAVLLTVAIVQERIHEERRRHALDRELRVAQEIQRGLLPEGSPQIAGFELVGWSQPASATGGDIYDFLLLPDGRWMIVLADASGHGVGPALMIAETRAVLRTLCLRSADPAAALEEVNKFLVLDFTAGNFVTCFLGFLEPQCGRLSYASAGQGPLILYRRVDSRFELLDATAIPLAIATGPAFRPTVKDCHLRQGDFLALVSDGLFEARNPAGQQFGLERLLEVLARNHDRPAAEMVRDLAETVEHFTQSAEPLDDCTVVILHAT
ncbi:MAG TPA: PP2C family protein-serine/threonine phosphatase [Planctomycetota bacterium]|nr:PP2C family protein-serine/threonine phosphatase [Planctomycetota bacterium]